MAPAEAVEGHENLWKVANRVNLAYLPYNAYDEAGNLLPKPERTMPPMPQAAIVQAKLGVNDDLKASAGQYDASMGRQGNETSGVAIAQRQREGDNATFHYIDNLSKGIRFLGKCMVDLIPKVYDTRRVVRLLGEDGTAREATFDPTLPQAVGEEEGELGKAVAEIYNPTVGRYDVIVSVGPSFSSKRQEAAASMIETVRAVPQIMGIAGDLVIKAQDWPGADEFAKRLKKSLPPQLQDDEDEEEIPPKAQAMLMQAEQMVQGLQAQNQELLQGKGGLEQEAQRVSAEKASVEAAKRELEAARKVAEAELRAKVAEATLRAKELEQRINERMAQAEQVQQPADTLAPFQAVLEQLAMAMQRIAESQAQFVAGQQQMMQAVTAERESELIDLPDGSMRARSRVVIPQEVQ